MRYRFCTICLLRPSDHPQVVTVLMTEELLGDNAHHHHITECTACETWWFADIDRSLRPLRRDTAPCDCPETTVDGRFRHSLIVAPERVCRCSKLRVDRTEMVKVYPRRGAA
jgi:hypothetical protein